MHPETQFRRWRREEKMCRVRGRRGIFGGGRYAALLSGFFLKPIWTARRHFIFGPLSFHPGGSAARLVNSFRKCAAEDNGEV